MDRIDEIVQQGKAEIDSAKTLQDLEGIRVRLLGRKGELTQILRSLASLPPEERRQQGEKANTVKEMLEDYLEHRKEQILQEEEAQRLQEQAVNLELPARRLRAGIPHILTQTMDRVKTAMISLGFEMVDMPEMEKFYYNFTALNYPPYHPAMDEHDTFYIETPLPWRPPEHPEFDPETTWVMRTHTTPFQGRLLQEAKRKPPLRVFTIGRCFRHEAVDRTHHHTFHQVDAFMVDEGVSMAHLRGTLGEFSRMMFGEGVQVRFRPDYFPFVEPGVDFAISCPFCKGTGKGCMVCKESGWIELGGAGMVHPQILRDHGIDTERYTGFAFGLGIERIPMIQYQIDDLRLFWDNDLRFLEQFPS